MPHSCIFPPVTWWGSGTGASEKNSPNYTPLGVDGFDAEKEWRSLEALVRETEARAESPEVTAELRAQALKRNTLRRI